MTNVTNLILQDCRLAARHLRISWPFALAAIATLALGIGANVTLFSLADSVMFRPVPLRDPDRLVIAGEGLTEARAEVSYLNFKDWQTRSRAFDGLAAMGSSDWPLTLLARRARGCCAPGSVGRVLHDARRASGGRAHDGSARAARLRAA